MQTLKVDIPEDPEEEQKEDISPLVVREESLESIESGETKPDIDANYELFRRQLFSIFKEKGIKWIGTYDVLYDMLRIAMELIEYKKYAKDGATKKQYVLFALRSFVKSSFIEGITTEQREMCLSLLKEGMFSNTIDMIVDASKSKLHVNTNLKNVLYEFYIVLCSWCCCTSK